jgi:hypothetical protein
MPVYSPGHYADPAGRSSWAGSYTLMELSPQHELAKDYLSLNTSLLRVQLVGATVNTWPPGIMK